MKRFKFRLERVLQIREAEKEERKAELLAANTALREGELELERLVHHFNHATLPNEIMTAAQVFLHGAYLASLKARIEKQRERNFELERKVDVAREAYREAAAAAEALQKLRKKRHDEYDAHVDREEGKFLDELAVQRGSK